MLNAMDNFLEARLRAGLPEAAFRPAAPHYFEEPRGKFHGQAALILAPATVEEVSTILRLANAARVGVVPYGGGTGLVAGQVATEGPAPILLSLERMTTIRAVHPQENVLIAEAGATLTTIHQAARDHDRLFPLSYGSQDTARIGGGLAVNSGGLNVLRYGTARDLCLGLEAVLPDGQIWHGLRRLRKDNTGYDLRNLLIGAEGTLGVITAAALRLFPQPAAASTALLVIPGPREALALLARAGRIAGETISAFELISGMGLGFLEETGIGHIRPFDTIPDWMVLTEIATGQGADPSALMEALFQEALEAGEVTDGVVAGSGPQRDALWHLRETIPEANRRIGAIASHDISLPLSEIPAFIDRATAALKALGPMRVNAFGHLGDGNLHFNLFPLRDAERDETAGAGVRATRIVHDLVQQLGGSFSAEHGLGRLKVDELERYGDPTRLWAMRAIKSALDPNGIMNPGAVLRPMDE